MGAIFNPPKPPAAPPPPPPPDPQETANTANQRARAAYLKRRQFSSTVTSSQGVQAGAPGQTAQKTLLGQ